MPQQQQQHNGLSAPTPYIYYPPHPNLGPEPTIVPAVRSEFSSLDPAFSLIPTFTGWILSSTTGTTPPWFLPEAASGAYADAIHVSGVYYDVRSSRPRVPSSGSHTIRGYAAERNIVFGRGCRQRWIRTLLPVESGVLYAIAGPLRDAAVGSLLPHDDETYPWTNGAWGLVGVIPKHPAQPAIMIKYYEVVGEREEFLRTYFERRGRTHRALAPLPEELPILDADEPQQLAHGPHEDSEQLNQQIHETEIDLALVSAPGTLQSIAGGDQDSVETQLSGLQLEDGDATAETNSDSNTIETGTGSGVLVPNTSTTTGTTAAAGAGATTPALISLSPSPAPQPSPTASPPPYQPLLVISDGSLPPLQSPQPPQTTTSQPPQPPYLPIPFVEGAVGVPLRWVPSQGGYYYAAGGAEHPEGSQRERRRGRGRGRGHGRELRGRGE